MVWALGILLVSLLVWAVLRSRHYARLYGDAHLLAIARALPALKRGALDLPVTPDDGPMGERDGRVLRTELGLALVFTLSAKRDGTLHHLSLSFPDQLVAQGTSELLLATVVHLLRWPAAEVRMSRGNDLVQHAQWHASVAAHTAWAAEPVLQPAASELRKLRVAALELRTGRRWGSEEMTP